MGALLDDALKDLDSTEPAVVHEALLVIGEIVLVNRLGNFRSDIIPAANEEVLAWGPLEVVQKRVIRFIEEDPDGPYAQSAFSVLGSFYDKDLRKLLTRLYSR